MTNSFVSAPRWLTVVAAMMVSFCSAAFAAEGNVTTLLEAHSLDAWKVEAAEGDSAKLSLDGPVLVVDYDVNINATRRHSHATYNEKRINLWLTKPIALDEKMERLIYEAFGNQAKTWSTLDGAAQLWPVIADASGEQLSYIPAKMSHMMSGGEGWSQWKTTDFYAGEAGGATQDVCQAQDGDGNCWPDGKLTFIGFRVIVRRSEFGRKQGRMAIGQIQAMPMKMPYVDPFFYADSALKTAGTYRLGASITSAFQGTPIREIISNITFDPASVESRRQRLAIPLGPDGDYWINYQITDASGKALTENNLRYKVNDNPQRAAAAKPIDLSQPPATGFIRLIPGGKPDSITKTAGIFESTEPLRATIRVFASPLQKTGATILKWRLTPYAFDSKIKEGEQAINISGANFQDIAWSDAGEAGRDSYKLKIELISDGKTLDRSELILGKKTDLSKAVTTRVGLLPSRERFKNTSYYRCSFITLSTKPVLSEDQAVGDFAKSIEEGRDVATNWTYMIDPAALEILPGVYDFALLDRVMDAAWDRGCALTIRMGHIDQEHPFRWLPFFRQHNYDNLEIDEHFYGGFALTDPAYLEFWHRSLKSIYDRYRLHPAFQGYYLLQPAGEATVEDKPWEGIIAGYEPPMRLAFQKYLRDTLKLSLEQLNLRWSTAYTSWDQIAPPLPSLRQGKVPDLSMQWVDFCNLKVWLNHSGWYPEAARRIRLYDQQRVIITYGGTSATMELSGIVDYFHNGGNHFLQNEGTLIDPWEKGKTGWISEPHHPHRWAAYGDPSERGWVLDWTIFVAMAQAGGGAANMHVYYDPRVSLQQHFGGTFGYDRLMKFRPIMDEMLQVKLVGEPSQVAVIQDALTLACKHRTTFHPRSFDMRRWFELLKNDSIAFEDYRDDHAAQYKMILPNMLDEVMSQDNIMAVDRAVRENGSKAIISAMTGKYCPQRGKEPFQLLKQLGINSPQGEYVQADAGVEAKIEQENPLLPKDFKAPFMTLGQLNVESESDYVKTHEGFWNWPFRFIPQTDYFGYYRDNKSTNGTVIARFASGGVALSRHTVGKGEVIVFWGIPNYRTAYYTGMMTAAAKWAGVTNARAGNPAPLMLEGHADATGRHYAILYYEGSGRIVQKIPTLPDGKWFVEELVADQKVGTWIGKEVRENGINVDFLEGGSPLKIIRFRAFNKDDKWPSKYRQPAAATK